MATAEAAIAPGQNAAAGEQFHNCEWETVVGPCDGSYPRRALQEIVFYDGRPMLICPNHFKVWERERGLYIKHIRVQ